MVAETSAIVVYIKDIFKIFIRVFHVLFLVQCIYMFAYTPHYTTEYLFYKSIYVHCTYLYNRLGWWIEVYRGNYRHLNIIFYSSCLQSERRLLFFINTKLSMWYRIFYAWYRVTEFLCFIFFLMGVQNALCMLSI